jgi:hypothetical protein
MERHREQLCAIRYEDLVLRPREELDRIAEWLEVDPGGFDEARIRKVQQESIGKHSSGLTRDELSVVMDIAGPAMARLGYS